MYLGKRLSSDSTIGIISPSGSSEINTINQFLEDFKNLGFNVKFSNLIYKKSEYLAGSDEDRANDLMNMFLDPQIDGIICFRGGFGAIRTLPFLDIDIIKNNPKFFCGYSDITVLLNYFSSLGIPTFHGPLIKSDFTKDTLTISSLKHFMYNPSKGYIYDFSKNLIINNNDMSGKLAGGNLSIICSLMGTPYEINLNNTILLIEEINEDPYSVDRLLSQLLLSKTIHGCTGIILGHFTNCDSSSEYTNTIVTLLLSKLKPLNIPIILNVPFGHDYPNLTFPIGVNAHFSKASKKLIISENALK
ncbi:MAG: S66 peptidase family protein [Clostridium sp.]|uniref:S66 peptidase family protein n=1 Tax=Clostridium sp. TaxID=1506 RepID=UPI003F3AB192